MLGWNVLQNSIDVAMQRAREQMADKAYPGWRDPTPRQAQAAPAPTPQAPTPAPADTTSTSADQELYWMNQLAAVDMSSPTGPREFMMIQMRIQQTQECKREISNIIKSHFDCTKELGRNLK